MQAVGKGKKKHILQGGWWLLDPLQLNFLSARLLCATRTATEASCGVFVMTSGQAGPGNLHVLPGLAGHWLSCDFFLSPPYLAGNLSLWRGRQWAFSWLCCLFCGSICLFPRGWACVSMGIRSMAALCSGNERRRLSSRALPGIGGGRRPWVSGRLSGVCGHGSCNCTLSSETKINKWNRCLIYSDGSQNAAFHVLIWFPGTRK